MSGDFGFSPAPRHASFEESSNIREARAHRDALRHQLDELVHLRDHVNNSGERRTQRMEQSALRDEIRRRHAAQRADTPGTSTNDVQPPTSALRTRFSTHRLRNRPSPSRSGVTFQQAIESLNEASPNLSSLLDQPIPRIGSPDMNLREYSGEAEVNRRRAKRRKLDSGSLSNGHLRGFSYGFRGQVVPGPLKMEIVSCDGGIHTDAVIHGRDYHPENVLHNDKSVYCTDRSECNLILQHMGQTPFTLKKLVIKAPEQGFTAPIQEGMIFVSMESTNLLARTSCYRMYDPPEDNEEFSNLFSDELSENRPLSRRRDSNAHRTIPPPVSNSVPRSLRLHNDTASTSFSSNPFPLHDLDNDSTPPPRTITPPETSGFKVTTTCDSPSSDEEEPSSAATLADLYRRNHFPPAYHIDPPDEELQDDLDQAMLRARELGLPTTHRHRRRRRGKPSRIEAMLPPGSSNTDTEVQRILPPHAKFFIQREKSVVSVKFDPPVSGRFILMKLWSPSKDQNIDIQSVVAHGFAGPRFFPAIHMM